VQEMGGGTVSPAGTYAAPTDRVGTFHVVATSVAAPATTGTATLNVNLQGMEVSPNWIWLRPGAAKTFQAVINSVPTPVTWSIQGNPSGASISAAGILVAPSAEGTYYVVATSTLDPTRTAVATVGVSNSVASDLSISPTTVEVPKGTTYQFTASIAGASWSVSEGSIDATGLFTAPNRATTVTVTATTADGAIDVATAVITDGPTDTAFTYDGNGNMTSDGTRTFEWDAENRLVAVTILATGHRSEFGYDGFGRRVEITEKDNAQVTQDTKYVWEGAGIVESRSADGSTSLQRYYAQGFMDSDGTALYYTKDHLGSIRELVDATGAIRARYDYDPYGRTTKISGDKDSPFLYTGHLWHAYSGLYLTLFREYDPNLGRWISRDPIGEKGGLYLYRYCFSDPINLIDPLGLSCTGRDLAFDGLGLALGIGAVLFPEVAIAVGIVSVAVSVINHYVAPSPGFSGAGVAISTGSSALGIFGNMGGTDSALLNEAGEVAGALGDAAGYVGIAVSAASTAVDISDCFKCKNKGK
jgi:RHS repeat-associated protein